MPGVCHGGGGGEDQHGVCADLTARPFKDHFKVSGVANGPQNQSS